MSGRRRKQNKGNKLRARLVVSRGLEGMWGRETGIIASISWL
jgi:hypothetical protein